MLLCVSVVYSFFHSNVIFYSLKKNIYLLQNNKEIFNNRRVFSLEFILFYFWAVIHYIDINTCICSPIDRNLSCFTVMLFVHIKLLYVQAFGWMDAFVSLGEISRSAVARSYSKCMFKLVRSCQASSKWWFSFTFPPATYERKFQLLHILANPGYDHSFWFWTL